MRPPALVLLLLPAAAWASQLEVLTLPNWQRLPVGDQALIEGGAVVARASGPAATYNNPAGLARLDRPSLSGSLSLGEYTRIAARAAGGRASTSNTELRPNLVGFAAAVDEDHPGLGGWGFVLAAPISWSAALEVRASEAGSTRRDDGRSSLEVVVPALAWGRPASEAVALGVAVEAWLVDYRYDSGTAAASPTAVLTSTYAESGRQLAMRLAFGWQWRSGAWQAGVLLRTPGISVLDSGGINAATTSADASGAVFTDVRAEDTGFCLPLPAQAVLGAAWCPPAFPGLQAEADLSLHAGHDRTEVFGPAAGTTTTLSGGTATVAPYSLPARHAELRLIANPRLGLRYRWPEPLLGRTIRLHLGGYLDQSPVRRSDVFTRLDLLGATAGVTAEKGPMLLTIGLAYITSSTLSEALGYLTSPSSGIAPDIADAEATFAVRTGILAIGTAYRF